MISWVWVYFLSIKIYAIVIRPGHYATETIKGHSLFREPQEFALITSAPRIDSATIQRRADVAICAYVSGDEASPLTCPLGASCTATGALIPGFSWACCDENQCLGDYKTCVDYGINACPALDQTLCTQIFTSILSCPSESPSCVAYARSSSRGDFDIQTSLGCGNSGGVIPARYSPTNGKGSDGEASPTSGGIFAPIDSTVVSQSSDTLNTFESSSSSSGPSLSIDPSPSSSGPSSSIDPSPSSTDLSLSTDSSSSSSDTSLSTYSSSSSSGTSLSTEPSPSSSGLSLSTGSSPSSSSLSLSTYSSSSSSDTSLSTYSSSSSSDTSLSTYSSSSSSDTSLSTYSSSSSSGPSMSIDSSPSDRSDPGSKTSTDDGLSRGAIAGIVIAIVGVFVTLIAGWWGRHEVMRCITCGRYGHIQSAGNPSVSHDIPLSTMPNHS